MPNFFEEAEMLEWAGIFFGEEDTYRLQKSIKVKLAFRFNSLLIEVSSNEWYRKNSFCW
jgi:hypothetical protein